MSEENSSSRKTIRVQCPGCQALLVVDAATGVVISHQEQKKEHQSMEEFLARQKTRGADLDAKLREAKEREKQKRILLDQKFQSAKNNPNLKDPPPGVLWD